ncbi:PREDICTED: keratin-associated protein 19-2-like [Gekko japonicus]|uniref:Keratin-associated protein 19-2-like n=1 Tax=Gekko japonicus TaxID=146911 RepID=A0ABM1L319_GEKJA|nr:PREDICTED: keratin-associated protein 19-2-like [Gekko japonicus]
MSLYRHQSYWDPCRRGSFSSGSYYGGSGQRICYYPQTSYSGYGRSYYPQTYWGGYGRSYMPPLYCGGYGYGRGYYPQQNYGGYGYGGLYGRRYGWGYGSRRGSMSWGYGSRRGSICYEPYGYSSGGCYPLKRRYSCSSIDGPC